MVSDNRPSSVIQIILFSIILMGISSVIAQTVLIRELLIVFYGNELCIGIVLASWLIWEAFGAGFFGYFIKNKFNSLSLFVFIQIIISFLLPFIFYTIKIVKNIINIEHGKIVGIIPTLYIPLIILAPVCILFGLQFSSACQIYTIYKKKLFSSYRISQVYIYEAIGWVIGGIAFSYIFIYIFSNFTSILVVSLLNMFFATLIILMKFKKSVSFLSFFLLIIMFIFFFSPIKNNAHKFMLKKQWKGKYRLLESKDSIYGNISVCEKENQLSIYQNGVLSGTSDDTLQNEEIVHFTLLRSPKIKKVLLIGGGITGTITEILKYPNISEVYYAELDPVLINLGRKYFKPPSFDNSKVKVINIDGRFFIKNKLSPDSMDCIIVNMPDPSTAQINRFYTLEFFKEVDRVLKENGIFSINISSSEDYISNELKEYNGSIYKTLKKVFKRTTIIPGPAALFISSQKKKVKIKKQRLISNLDLLKNDNKYVQEGYIYYRIDNSRIKYVREILEKNKNIKINSDFFPISYYYSVALWVSSYQIKAKNIFNTIKKIIKTDNLIILITLISIIFIALIYKKKSNFSFFYIAVTSGFSIMACELVLLLMFQVFYGYIYSMIGVLTAFHMLGMAIGSKILNKKHINALKTLKFILIFFFLFLICLPKIFKIFSTMNSDLALTLISHVLFPFLTFSLGFFTGAIFVLTNKVWLKNKEGKLSLQQGGAIYSFDLLGAASGSLLSGIILIPLLGISSLCFVLAVVILFDIVLLFVY